MPRNFAVNDEVIYQERVWIIREIFGRTATIHARESHSRINYEDLRVARLSEGDEGNEGLSINERVAKRYGATLRGEPFPARCAEGAYVSQKLVWPARTEIVDVELLKHR